MIGTAADYRLCHTGHLGVKCCACAVAAGEQRQQGARRPGDRSAAHAWCWPCCRRGAQPACRLFSPSCPVLLQYNQEKCWSDAARTAHCHDWQTAARELLSSCWNPVCRRSKTWSLAPPARRGCSVMSLTAAATHGLSTGSPLGSVDAACGGTPQVRSMLVKMCTALQHVVIKCTRALGPLTSQSQPNDPAHCTPVEGHHPEASGKLRWCT